MLTCICPPDGFDFVIVGVMNPLCYSILFEVSKFDSMSCGRVWPCISILILALPWLSCSPIYVRLWIFLYKKEWKKKGSSCNRVRSRIQRIKIKFRKEKRRRKKIMQITLIILDLYLGLEKLDQHIGFMMVVSCTFQVVSALFLECSFYLSNWTVRK